MPTGVLYATDLGTKNIKVFDPHTGALLRTIGKPGGQHVGKWDPERLDNPLGITVDAAGKLWVADTATSPSASSASAAMAKWKNGSSVPRSTAAAAGWTPAINRWSISTG